MASEFSRSYSSSSSEEEIESQEEVPCNLYDSDGYNSEEHCSTDVEQNKDESVTWTTNLRQIIYPSFDSSRVGANFFLPSSSNEIDFLFTFLPVHLITSILVKTNRCARSTVGSAWIDVSLEEFRAYLGLNIAFALLNLHSYQHAWSTIWPFSIPAIPEIMTRHRFQQIDRYLNCHIDENRPARTTGHDKLGHIRHVLDIVLDRCRSCYDLRREQSIDEAMIGFKGRLGFKQYMPMKPNKFGIKVWMRADPSNGYVSYFQVYTGREGNSVERELGARVVRDLTRDLEGRYHHIYMDNFFSSTDLFLERRSKGVLCCGTTRQNRKGWPRQLRGKKVVKSPGESKCMQFEALLAYVWYDKKQVSFLSTCVADPNKTSTVKRKSGDGTRKEIECPGVVTDYTMFMGGVDRADQLRAIYPTKRKSRKWWKYLFWFLFDVAVVNAFICMSESANHQQSTSSGRNKRRTQFQFRRNLVIQLISTYRGGRKRSFYANMHENLEHHYPVPIGKSRRCRRCSKKFKRRRDTTLECDACNVSNNAVALRRHHSIFSIVFLFLIHRYL